MPTDELTAIGSYSHQAGSEQIANETAQAFCARWRAVPSTASMSTTYQGKLLGEKTQEGINTVAGAVPALHWGTNKTAYQTTLKYKCY